ncbi:immunity 49 family protein [Pseudoalteromonas luteoviolacea]|uniref:Immunity 49 family protein n=1 Tax=Pseudoalteromonas luteoviolacea S4060-1 TaxID=1365257 RepID=A0A167JB02_9GAMM|nr:immunity 49 family protein [Pseudoalteromonas luteoviolacea]KZN60848.1 hypothetical protein N478_25930 [Pseudoalteromonas luteoviolacea S4060-1]
MSALKCHFTERWPLSGRENLLNYTAGSYVRFWQSMFDESKKLEYTRGEPKGRLAGDFADPCLDLIVKNNLVRQEPTELVLTAARDGLDLLCAHYHLAMQPDELHIYSIREGVFRSVGDSRLGAATMQTWLTHVCMTLAFRDFDALGLMCEFGAPQLNMAGAKPDRFDFALVELVKGAFRSGADLPKLVEALTLAAAPDNIEPPRRRYVYNLYLPFADTLIAILNGDQAHYERAFTAGIEAHYDHYNVEEPELNHGMAFFLTAAASLANDQHGWACPETPYVPQWIVKKAFTLPMTGAPLPTLD